MAFATVQAVGTPNSGTTGSVTYAIPAHQSGDILLLVVETGNTTGITAPTDWAHITNSPRAQGSNVTAINVLWLRAASGSTTDPVVSGVANHQDGVVVVVRGAIASGDPWDFAPVASSNAINTTFSATGGTTTVADALVFIAAGQGFDGTTDQISGISNGSLANLTEQFQVFVADGNGGGVGIWTGEKATAGATGTTTGNANQSAAWAALTFAIVPAAGDATVTAPVGTMALDGLAPVVSGGATVDAPVDGAALDGLAPTVAGGATVAGALGAAALAGLAPTLTGGATVAAPVGTAALDGPVPTVSGGGAGGATVDAPVGAATLAGLTPTVAAGATVTAPVGAATLAGLAPTVTTGATVAAPVGTTTLTGLAPTVTGAATVTATLGTVALAGLPATVSGGATITGVVGAAVLAGYAPDVTDGAVSVSYDLTGDVAPWPHGASVAQPTGAPPTTSPSGGMP